MKPALVVLLVGGAIASTQMAGTPVAHAGPGKGAAAGAPASHEDPRPGRTRALT